MKEMLKKAAAVTLAFAMVFGMAAVGPNAIAAKKAPKLSKTKLSLSGGTMDDLKVKKNKVSKIVKTTWTTSNKKIAKLTNKKKTSVTVNAGTPQTDSSATVKAKVTYKIGKKKYTKTLKCTVKVYGSSEDIPNVGGWSVAKDPFVPSNIIVSVEDTIKAIDPSISFKPLALLATQIVNGTNYRVLGVFSNAKMDMIPSYAILEFNQSSEGTWTLLSTTTVLKADIPVFEKKADAGIGVWNACEGEDVKIGADDKAVFDAAVSNLDGVNYTPIAKIATCEAVLTNYCFICENKIVVPNAEPTYCLVYVTGDNSDTGTFGADVNGTDRSVDDFSELRLAGV